MQPYDANVSPVNPAKNVYQYYILTGEYSPSKDGLAPTTHSGDEVPPGVFGNLEGLRTKLPEIKKMGFDTIWLGPVTQSNVATGHGYGYDAIDYKTVNPLLGTDGQFRSLMEDAHKHGLKVILDMAFNHTSEEHPWFAASKKGEGEYKDYYVWQKPILRPASESPSDERIKQAVIDACRDGKDPRVAVQELVALKVPLRDSHGNVVMEERLREDGTVEETQTPATIALAPMLDWEKGALTSDGAQKMDNNSNLPRFNGQDVWLAPPKRDANGNILYAPNNYLCFSGDAWKPVTERGECFLHVFHESMPDLNIGNPALNEKLIDSCHHWINQGADGFRMDAASFIGTHWSVQKSGEAQYKALTKHDDPEFQKNLAEALGVKSGDTLPAYDALNDKQRFALQAFVAGISSNPPNTFQAIGIGGDSPFVTPEILKSAREKYYLGDMSDEDVQMYLGTIAAKKTRNSDEKDDGGALLTAGGYRDQMHVRDVSQPCNLAFWKEFKTALKSEETDAGRPLSVLFENGDNLNHLRKMAHDDILNPAKDAAYVSTFDHVKTPQDLRAAVEKLQSFGDGMFAEGTYISHTPSNHDTTRIASRFGYDENPKATKLLWSFFSRLPGNLCVYGGEELGLPNPTLEEIKPLENRDPFGYHSGRTAYNYGGQNDKTHDSGRTAYPWSQDDLDPGKELNGQGRFFRTPASWIGKSYQEQMRDPESVLHHYMKIMKDRAQDPILSAHGKMQFLDGGTHEKDVLIYSRSNDKGAYLFVDNFTDRPVTVNLQELWDKNKDLLDDQTKECLQKRLAAGRATQGGSAIVIPAWESARIGQEIKIAPSMVRCT